jgi:hypothetical protein
VLAHRDRVAPRNQPGGVGVRGIFSPCPQKGLSMRVRSHVSFRATETALIEANGTQTMVFLSFYSDTSPLGYAVLPVLDRDSPYRAGVSIGVLDYCGADVVPLGTEPTEVEEERNLVEFRSLPPSIESLADYRGRVHVSTRAAEYARSRRGHVFRVESQLEEEPE